MIFRFNITLTEEEYLTFNCFHSFEWAHGKKQIGKTRTLFTLVMAIIIALVVLINGWSTFSIAYAIILALLTAAHMLWYKKIMKHSIKAQIKRLKKIGKLPFDPMSTIEFYEDKMVETTDSKRIEQKYSTFERICVVSGRFILLYYSSVAAYILPFPQIKAQANLEKLLGFLSSKCKVIEYY